MNTLQRTVTCFTMLAAFAGTALAQAPSNDDCSGAINIANSFGGATNIVMTSGPYTNVGATTNTSDPTTGYECFGEGTAQNPAPSLENTVWFTFVGDGNEYFIETGNCSGTTDYIDDGDTQIAIYSGVCGNLTPVGCNEDGPSSTSTTYPAGLTLLTTNGTTYYMMVDGYKPAGGPAADGQFCINVKRTATINCGDAAITPGTATANKINVCYNDTLFVTTTGVVAPTVGEVSGVVWAVSLADLNFSNTPKADSSYYGSFPYVTPAPSTHTRGLINNGAALPAGTYYFTPIVFGNATRPTSGTVNFNTIILDSGCTYTGQSIMVNFLADGDPQCVDGLANTMNSGFKIHSLYPVPAQQVLNFTLTTSTSSTAQVSVKDMLGREVSVRKIATHAGDNNISISLDSQSAGIYFVTVTDGTHNAVAKFVKQ